MKSQVFKIIAGLALLSLPFGPAIPTRAQEQPDVPLEQGQTIERELAGGQTHSYRLALAAGQYLTVEVNQKGIDVVLLLFNPEGKQLLRVDGPNGPNGLELLSVVIETGGSYRVEVRSFGKNAPAGRYTARISELHAATAEDRAMAESRRLFSESVEWQGKGKLDEAIKSAERAVTVREQAFGSDHAVVAPALNWLALLYDANGDYARAASSHRRALAIREQRFGPDHAETAKSANNLALIYKGQGDYAQAEPLFRQALAAFEKNPGPDKTEVALASDNLAAVYLEMGDYARAEPLFQRALEIRVTAYGENHRMVAYSLNNLAVLYDRMERYDQAAQLHRRALAVKEKLFGPEHPEIAVTLNNLARVYYHRDDYAQAKQHYQRALAILEKKAGSDNLDLANSFTGLGAVFQIEGDYPQAETFSRRALAIREKILGPEHTLVAQSLNNLSWFYRAKNDPHQAVSFLARGHEILERNLSHNLLAGSERQKLAYLNLFAHHTDQAVSLHVQVAPENPLAVQLAVTALLRRKGRTLDAMTDSLAQLRRHATAPDLALFDRLTATRSQLATLTLSGAGSPDYRSFRLKLERLEEQMEKTEAEISARSAEFKAQLQPVTLANVQSAIPAGAALVELAVYSPFDQRTRSFGSPRYVAYVITSSGLPRWAELGEAAGIDGAADDFRRALRSPKRSEIKRVARRVDEMAMRPIRALLGDARRVFISPYGSLNLIPFAALVDERNRYLVERYSFSYLTSGRDLLRLQSAAPSRSEPLIVADPAFGELAAATGRAERGLGLQANVEQNLNPPPDFSGIAFKPLPGVAGEAQSLRRLLPRARTLTGAQATETALKQTSGPSILHIATHGFFLKDAEVAAGNTRGFGLSLSHAPAIPGATLSDNPLLRSGLALAGANERRSGNDDGILTALEVAGLDLWGTKLVALSACNTGVGEVSRSEGVYGLRRALVLAGAETQVMSLWPVSDRGTRDLMIAYYRALTRGEGRSEALRQVQLRMLQSKGRRHPYYWASFIQSGEWKNLDGKEPGVK